MTHPRTGYIRSRASCTPSRLLADIGARLEGAYAERSYDPAIADLCALLELCQRQRLTLEQWTDVCRMRCPGTQGIAELVRALDVAGVCTSDGQEDDSMV